MGDERVLDPDHDDRSRFRQHIRVPRGVLPESMSGQLLLTYLGPVEAVIIERAVHAEMPSPRRPRGLLTSLWLR